jgi:hypothetical protein
MSGRSVSRIRTRSRRSRSRARSVPRVYSDIDLDRIDPARMLRHLVALGVVADPNVAPPRSDVPEPPLPDTRTQAILEGLEQLIQRSVAQSSPTVTPAPVPTATTASAPAMASSGKSSLKFPDPPFFEGDPVKLDPWLTQTTMYLRAYDVDLASSRSVEVATMFLRGKASDWWTGQFHLIASGSLPGFGTWASFVSALTAAFRPVELHKKYLDQLLGISQGKSDMRSYIASFNALRAKVPKAFSEDTLCHLFLQGCKAELQKNISLQYPQTLDDYFKHAITISDIPGSSRTPHPHPKDQTDSKGSEPPKISAQTCTHCGKSGHSVERCFQLHPELRKRRSKPKQT